jgi:hypothetical protein
MVRALRIISIAAIIASAIVLILPFVIGLRTNPEIEKCLKEPGAAEKFASAGERPGKSEVQSSPLVKQATDFGLYLNPPPPSTPVQSAESDRAEPAPLAIVTPKFNLIGTSYYALHPELSLALIDEPGNGLHWVREGNSIGHLKIEKVKDGSITLNDGQRTSEMTVKVTELWRRLLKNGSADSQSNAGEISQTESAKIVSSAPTAGQYRASARPGTITAQRSRTNPRGVPPLPGPPSSSTPSPPPAAKTKPEVEPSPLEKEIQAKTDKLIAELSSTAVSPEETSKKLDEIGKLLNQLEKIRASQQPSHQK